MVGVGPVRVETFEDESPAGIVAAPRLEHLAQAPTASQIALGSEGRSEDVEKIFCGLHEARMGLREGVAT
jgi:hypothetical protein